MGTPNDQNQDYNAPPLDEDLGADTGAGEGTGEHEEHPTGDGPSGGERIYRDSREVPEELRASFKRMQAAMTRKSQDLAALRRQYESSVEHAEAFRTLIQDPRVQQFLVGLQNPENEGGGRRRSAPLRRRPDEDMGDEGDIDLDTMLEERTKPLAQRLTALENRVAVSNERAQLESRHPDWGRYKQDMRRVMQEDPSLSMTAAYKVARFDRAQRLAERKKREQRSIPPTGTGNSAAGRVTKKEEPGKILSFEEARDAAIEELGLDKKQFGLD